MRLYSSRSDIVSVNSSSSSIIIFRHSSPLCFFTYIALSIPHPAYRQIGIRSIEQLAISIVVDGDEQLAQKFPHFEVEIMSMHDGVILAAQQEPGAGRECQKIVNEVVEEDFLEGIPAQLGQCVQLGHDIFVCELSAGVDLDSVVKGLGRGQQVDEFHEAGERVHEVADYGAGCSAQCWGG